MSLPKLNFRKLKGFVYKHRISVAVVSVALVFAGGALWYGLNRDFDTDFGPLKLKQKVETRVAAPLTGELVDPAVITKRPIAVVIENFTEARPQSGYNEADIVYETLAEGGITRTLAIFHSKDAKEIGPVRSARPYFVEWAASFGALFAHVGGSTEALNLIGQLGVADLSQFYNSNYFWRSNDRYAPHNVYTTTAKLYDAAKVNKYDLSAVVGAFKFKKDLSQSERPATASVNIDFSYDDYVVSYNYDPKSNSYQRFIAGVIAKDKNTGLIVSPKNVIVEFTPISAYINGDGGQAMRITTTGGGKGYLFQDGKTVEINWAKATRNSRTKYTDSEGKEILLNPGQTWIEVVPTGNSVTYK